MNDRWVNQQCPAYATVSYTISEIHSNPTGPHSKINFLTASIQKNYLQLLLII